MGNIAIRVENLSKQYRIGELERYKTLRDSLTDALYAPFRRFRSNFKDSHVQMGNSDNTIWALKDVSFEVNRGDVIGVIGRNGAGKSTLLKILSRITEPTEGYAEIRGRVGSLLEVGTGFHPELTGRENIYLNGAVLGMKRVEIDRKFDEIVAFAEIEKFIDTPVKRYSSGMYVRLAFAVAAHLEPEILLVDEVLSVGDAAFQKKCLGKMRDVSEQGRTVLFISHNMTAVATLTQHCLELKNGVVTKTGPPQDVIAHYLLESSDQFQKDGCFDLTHAERPFHKVNAKTAKAFFVKALCLDTTGRHRSTFFEGESLTLQVYFQVRMPVDTMEISSSINTTMDVRIFSMLSEVMAISLQPGLYQVSVNLDPNYLRPGDYYADLSLRTPSLQDGIRQAVRFRIEPSPEAQDNVNWSYHNLGVVRLPYQWTRPTAAMGDLRP